MLECIWFIFMWKIFLSGKLPAYTRLLKVWDLQNRIGCSRKFNVMKYGLTHWTFLPKRPYFFWSAPRIATQFSEYLFHILSQSDLTVVCDSQTSFVELVQRPPFLVLTKMSMASARTRMLIAPNDIMGAFKLMTVTL